MGFRNLWAIDVARKTLKHTHCPSTDRIRGILAPSFGKEPAPWRPAVVIREDGESVEVRADISGIPPGDFLAEVVDGCFVIRGAREGASGGCRERVVYCSIPLDVSVVPESMRAAYRGDMLMITYRREDAGA